MSDGSEDEDYAFFGTPLDPIEEDDIPSKKPTPIEDQVVRDQYGRRRFHGAFTGGFSAGYHNTVGSEEGWTPAAFKSSRSEKASQQSQKPEDFMDEEDKSVFGFAPKVLRATSDFKQSSSRKRPHMNVSTGPIPGQPVLRDILRPVKDTVGVRLLRNMGWRPGQGVGPRLNLKQKRNQQKEIKRASKKIYGCQLPGSSSAHSSSCGEDSSEESDSDLKSVTFAPDDYDAFVVKVKDDVFGIGYSGLDKRPVLSGGSFQLFEPSFLGMQEKKKKVAIWGQAFGVGALEEDDEDIYAKDDMSRYDFALESNSMIAQCKREERAIEQQGRFALAAPRGAGEPIDGFVMGKHQPNSQRKYFKPPELPPGYKAIHETKQSRWDVNSKGENVAKKQGLGRHDIDARVRASILDEPLPKPSVPPHSPSDSTVPPPQSSPRFPPISFTSSNAFQPFSSQPDKQARYEQFLELAKKGQKDLLSSIQPASMTEWDREHEKVEFEQAARLYKPLGGVMSDRFVSASQPDDSLDPLAPVERMKHGNEEMRNAAKMKMFGKLTRTRGSWQPCALLCKRFNVPQPSGVPVEDKRSARSSFSVFDYLEASANNTHKSSEDCIKQEDTPQKSPAMPEKTAAAEEHSEEQPHATKTFPTISDTLARLLADETGQIQPEPEEKLDLFKAIFLSSSEDSEEEEPSETNTISGSNKKSEQAPRNLSPPRGIFANLDLDSLKSRPAEVRNEERDLTHPNSNVNEQPSLEEDKEDNDLMYGPRLPSTVPRSSSSVPPNSNLIQVAAPISSVWVERDSKPLGVDSSSDSDESSDSSDGKKKIAKKKKLKKHSKHKKQKKHKKHKSKSKHKKKS